MSSNSDESIPGLEVPEPPAPPMGEVEASLRKQFAELRRQEVITDAHAAWEAHAIATGRDIDRSEGVGRPSGRAALRDSLTKILESMPQPEVTQTSELDKVLHAIMGGSAEE